MYETFFGLKRRPFPFIPDVEAYFSVEAMEEARLKIERTIQKGEGISLIFGASGTGKTLLLRILQQSLETEYPVVLASNSRLETPRDLFLQLFHDLHLAPSGRETIDLRLELLDFVQQKFDQGMVLLFDDAQYLPPSVLEEIRLLTDTMDDSLPLFRAVLAGTMVLEEKLTFPDLETFNQRVVSRCYLDSFSGDETSRYIIRQTDNLRMDPPHSASSSLFTEEAKRRIYQLTNGVPRLINQLCGTALQFAAAREAQCVDGALINDAWTNLQHIETSTQHAGENDKSEQSDATVQESTISPEQIEEIVGKKRETFQLRRFEPVEFGTLADSDADDTEVLKTSRSVHDDEYKEYKPPYPEDDESVELEEPEPEVYRLPGVLIQASSVPEKFEVTPRCQCVSNIVNKHRRKYRRRYLVEKIRHRLGLFAGVLRNADPSLFAPSTNESNMNEKSLQEYGAAVLDGRPPFVRREPHYAYQTTDTAPKKDVTYPDPKTGVPIVLSWLPEKTGESDRFGVSYSEFLNRAEPLKHVEPEKSVAPNKEPETEQSKEPKTEQSKEPETEQSKEPETEQSKEPETEQSKEPETEQSAVSGSATPIVRTSFKASLGNSTTFSPPSGLEESFDESQQVGGSAISLAELFRVDSQRLAESAEFKSLDETVQRQLAAVVQRITRAAEKIEAAAAVSERAGRHVSKAAEFVETEVKAALPTYNELFQQWSEFQNVISAELESARQRHAEPLKFQTFPPRRPVRIERTVSSINVEALLQ